MGKKAELDQLYKILEGTYSEVSKLCANFAQNNLISSAERINLVLRAVKNFLGEDKLIIGISELDTFENFADAMITLRQLMSLMENYKDISYFIKGLFSTIWRSP